MRLSSFFLGALTLAVSSVHAYCVQDTCEDATPKDCSDLGTGTNFVSTPIYDDNNQVICYQCCKED